MKKIIFLITVLSLCSCENIRLQMELDECKAELNECKANLAACKERIKELESFPQVRLAKAQEYFIENDFINALKELNIIVDQFEGTTEAKQAQSLITKIKQEKPNNPIEQSTPQESFNNYIKQSEAKGYTCIKTQTNAVYVIHSLTSDQTKWEYYEIGKSKITYQAKLKGSLPFSLNDMNLIGWELTDTKGQHLLGAVAMNLQTYKRAIVLYKNGRQLVFDEVK